MTALNPASSAQIGAADPDANVWLVANAGSGKTKVLTDRVARLLLRGTDPQNILCLTYTKAAAAEMQNRLFKRLGEWAMQPDAELRDNLGQLGEGENLSDRRLRLARQLFARAIETPGGIRIQTIHSFCAGLLRRFPLEAGVSPAFTELDDRSAALLRAEILEEMAAGDEARLYEAVLPDLGERADILLGQIVSNRAILRDGADEDALRAAFGLPQGYDFTALLDEVFGPGDLEFFERMASQLAKGGSNDNKAAAVFAGLKTLDLATLVQLEGVLLYKTGEKAFTAKTGAFPTKGLRASLGADLDHLDALMARIEDARPRRLALSALRRARAVHAFAAAFLARYEEAKARAGWLDFDDFITHATRLLTDPATAPWVLYRLDGAIDHVLVDEAQDTSPAQWKIIAALTEEFTAGDGARATQRSLFVVGDRKQSIYSFQGADVAGFDRVREGFAARFRASGQALSERAMIHSFRSSQAILSLVDLCFPDALQAALGGAFRHEPFFAAMPGRVDIWPVVPKPETPEPHEWYDPIDLQGETDAPVVLAEQIAAEIDRLVRSGTMIPERGGFRPLRPGDFLILVQRRGPIFHAIIRACKARGLPIAGPDRLTLTNELAVRDVMALLAFLNLPEDDLSLATALRSPLLGWDEAALHALAQPRKGYLWEALRDAPGALAETSREMLGDLRRWAEFLRPYELIERILTRHRGRERLLGRLGDEAADAIDELSQQALAYERSEVPTLTGFLVWMAAGDVEVKRQAEGEGRLIRVMTVHGSKGLEAPVVILPDTATRRNMDRDLILPMDESTVTWASRKSDDSPAVAELKERRAAAREAENLRLLYVAMTRARSWLILTGAGECSEGSWYGLVEAGAAQLDLQDIGEGRRRHQFGDWPAPLGQPGPGALEAPDHAPAPAFALQPAPSAPPVARIWAASGLGGDKLVTGEALPLAPDAWRDDAMAEGDPMARGTLLHLLLEHLPGRPADTHADLATRLGASPQLLAEASRMVNDPELAFLFAPGTLAEVEISAPWARRAGVEEHVIGAIDRLVITPDQVLIVDFKSNAQVPARIEDTPEGYLRQLGAYAMAASLIWPGRRIETAILWTSAPKLARLPAAMVEAALARSPLA